jgi:hypothetical protein
MGLRQNAPYVFGKTFRRDMPLNDDQTIPTPERMFGGVGPFDFSGVSDDTAVELKIKDDNEAVQNLTVDVSGAVSVSAVTVDELVTALTTTFTALDYTASKAAGKDGSDRIKIVSSASPLPTYVQLYGEFAEISMFGQGYGLKFIKWDTLKTNNFSPVRKDDEDITTTDSDGRDTTVKAQGYEKGVTITIIDAASEDEEFLKMACGYSENSGGGIDSGTEETTRRTFFSEFYWPYYARGTNQEADIVGYVQKTVRNCTAMAGDDGHERGFTDGNHTIEGLNYKDESSNILGAVNRKELTKSQYAALNLLTV